MMRLLFLALFALLLQAQETAVYPGGAATTTDLPIAVNNYKSTLTAPVGLNDTTINVATTTGAVVPIILYLEPLTSTTEELRCTSKTSATFSVCTRAFDHTIQATHPIGAKVENDVSAYLSNKVNAEVIAIETDLINHTWWPSATTPANARTALGIYGAFSGSAPVVYDGAGNFACPTCVALSSLSATTPIEYDGFGTFSCPTCQVSAGNVSSSVTLNNNLAVVGGGGHTVKTGLLTLASLDPAILSGNGSKLCTVSGVLTSGHLVVFDSLGNCIASAASIDNNGFFNSGGTPISFSQVAALPNSVFTICSDCTQQTSPCTSGGGGAFLFKINDVARCF